MLIFRLLYTLFLGAQFKRKWLCSLCFELGYILVLLDLTKSFFLKVLVPTFHTFIFKCCSKRTTLRFYLIFHFWIKRVIYIVFGETFKKLVPGIPTFSTFRLVGWNRGSICFSEEPHCARSRRSLAEFGLTRGCVDVWGFAHRRMPHTLAVAKFTFGVRLQKLCGFK